MHHRLNGIHLQAQSLCDKTAPYQYLAGGVEHLKFYLPVYNHTHTRARAHTHTHIHPCYGPLHFVRDYPGEPVPEPIWILLKQETVSSNGISWAICKSAPCPREARCRFASMPAPHHSVFTGLMPFLPPNQQRQSTERRNHLPGCIQ